MSTLSSCVSNGNTSVRDNVNGRNRSSSWCFTLNNYTADEVSTLSSEEWDIYKIKKYVFQKETAPSTGTKHLQGVVQFKNQVSFTTMKKINGKANWKRCRDLRASIKYCSKPFFSNGSPKRDVNTDVYWFGIGVEKMIWKDKVINTMSHTEMNENLMKMRIADSHIDIWEVMKRKYPEDCWLCMPFPCDCERNNKKKCLGF